MTEDDIPHAPYVAVSADPWSGPVAVYASDGGQDYSQELLIPNRSVIGRTTTAIVSKSSAIEDKGIGCVVEIGAGRLQSISQASAAAGYNLAVLGNPETQVWEVIQFLTAELVGPSRYRLRNIRWWLRGTDAERPDIWPEGTQFILLGHTPTQISLRTAHRNHTRSYRIGPASRGPMDPSYHEMNFSSQAKGLRPLSPVHMRQGRVGSDLQISWVRRGRIHSDDWLDTDIPIGEEREEYVISIYKDGEKSISTVVSQPAVTWAADTLAQIGYPNRDTRFEVEVAQVSATYGLGQPLRRSLG